MVAAPIAKDLSPIGNIPESVVREIAKVEPSKRQEVYDKATETASGHVPTAREIKQVVEMEEEEIKETSPVKNQPMQINILNKGMTHYAAAKAELDKIHKDDLHREQALKEIIRYAKNRLEANK
jgi:DNA-directed RNA polymerase specialized sigma subunit